MTAAAPHPDMTIDEAINAAHRAAAEMGIRISRAGLTPWYAATFTPNQQENAASRSPTPVRNNSSHTYTRVAPSPGAGRPHRQQSG